MKLVIHDFKDESEVPKQLFNDDIYMKKKFKMGIHLKKNQ